MRKIDIIRERLEKNLQPLQLKLLDESAHHIGHAGAKQEGETHFRIEIISKKFEGLSRMQRHRLVYSALGNAFESGLHAVEIYANSPEE